MKTFLYSCRLITGIFFPVLLLCRPYSLFFLSSLSSTHGVRHPDAAAATSPYDCEIRPVPPILSPPRATRPSRHPRQLEQTSPALVALLSPTLPSPFPDPALPHPCWSAADSPCLVPSLAIGQLAPSNQSFTGLRFVLRQEFHFNRYGKAAGATLPFPLRCCVCPRPFAFSN